MAFFTKYFIICIQLFYILLTTQGSVITDWSRADDPRLGALLTASKISNATYKIGIIGYPCDEGVARNKGRVGSRLGPESFRKYLPKIGSIYNQELNIDISSLSLTDLGDAPVARTLEETHINLKRKVTQALNEGFLPVVIGGGNDESYPNARALMDHLGNGNIAVINIDAHLDARPLLEGNKAHSGSPFRQLLDDPDFNRTFVEFANQASVCSAKHAQYVTSRGGKILWLSTMRRSETSLVKKFVEILKSFSDKPTFVSFDIDSIKSSDGPGVSAPGTLGLTAEEATEMCREAGKNKNVRLLDMSEFNPQIEEDRTARLIVHMFYNFLLGVAERQKTSIITN